MSVEEENKAIARRFVDEVLNKQNLATADELVAEDFVELDPLPGQEQGREGLRACFAGLKVGIVCTLLCMRKSYSTDLSDEEWAHLKTYLPASKLPGKMRVHALREIFDAIFYVLKSGCPWRLLPGDFPLWQTVFYHFRRFRLSGLWHRIFTILRVMERKRNGKDPNPSAAIVDSQSVKTTEESAGWKGYEAHSNGYDAHKNVKGRKRHLLVDTLGLPLSIYVTPADVQDRAGALLAGWTEAVDASSEEDLG